MLKSLVLPSESHILTPSSPTLWEPPLLVSFENTFSAYKNIIQTASLLILSVPNPREFQFVGAHHCAFKDDSYLAMICHTVDGKSLIPQIVGVLWRAVCNYLVPLIGLGSDQVKRSTVVKHNIEPYHVNEHKNADARLLTTWLKQMTKDEAKYVTIALFLGPNAMISTRWGPCWRNLQNEDSYLSSALTKLTK